jgi:hypothetical protein
MTSTVNARTSAALGAALLMSLPGARAEWIDFAQLDVSPSATTVVLVSALGAADAARPAPVLSATYTRWSTGEAAGAGLVYRWALPLQTQHWLVGAGVGANANRSWAPGDAQNDAALAAWAQSEWFGSLAGGSYYALAQISSYRGTWLATAQYQFAAQPVAVEWTRYHERGYQSTSVGFRFATGVPRWFVRLGLSRGNGETGPYVGLVYNAF